MSNTKAGLPQSKRSVVRANRADEVCRELRYQISSNEWDGNRLAELLQRWMKVAKDNIYTRP